MKASVVTLWVTCMLFLSMCTSGNQMPEKKNNIPREAQWYGGKDGGVWILINSSNTVNHFDVAIYNENDGSLISKGTYMFENDLNDTLTVLELKSIIDAFDGEKILLQKNKQGKVYVLKPNSVRF